jgi:hypothetical protein
MRTRRNRRSGNMIIECAMWIPFVLLLLVGMIQIAKITYVYYTVKKTLYTVGRYIATAQGVNFCDTAGDTVITAAKNFALTGALDGGTDIPLPALTTDLIDVSTECIDSSTGDIGACSTNGCDGPGGPLRPDFVVVSIPDGYQVSPRIPYMLIDPILLKPQVRVPFGGT